jgi:CTD small phosphatase-like protein 2
VTLLYKGLYYSVNNLKGPSQEYINKKKVKLPEPAGKSLSYSDSKKKFLVLDLDETLIHSVFTNEKTDVKFTSKGDEFKFNVRPYCYEFLANMSNHYNVYVFTAGTLDYAEPIIAYLNQKKKTIQGFLHRKNCMETQNGFFIKDLRIIQNR